ncbi:MAG: MgtC/SapB family protein [Oscillospiraceae bacterium]|nr:MgtC/SapB family protein [Oscillospiraceae bacterium]
MVFLSTFESTAQLFHGGMPITGMDATDVLLRILSALLVGILVGSEREKNRHPAGLRTNTLVALGACIVMITSESLFNRYNAFTNMDPARLGAQVITGVGFLGAGTIIHKGITIQGLTTAAGLWAVACLGLAAGNGDYFVVFVGTAVLILVLSALEGLQKKLFSHQDVIMAVGFETENLSVSMKCLNDLTQKNNFTVRDFEFDEQGKAVAVRVHLGFHGVRARENFSIAISALLADETIQHLDVKELEDS